jgi:CubicO group peptidase (beta-lactamase class C family)
MNEFWNSLDEPIRKMQAAWGVPGVSVAVVKDDRIVYGRGFGVRTIGKPEPVDEHSVFAIGSCTKAFTATGIGMLVQEGRLSWEDPVIQHLPGFKLFDPFATREIRVRDLLCHRCGLATFSGDFMGYGSRYTRQEVMERIRFIPPAFQLRAGFGYSNLMFMAAGEIIQVVSGLTWEEFVRQRLIEPLGMSRTTTDVQLLQGMDNVAQPHAFGGGQLSQVPYMRLISHAASGAINSSAWDMAQWLRFQLARGIFEGIQIANAAILEETRTPHTLLQIDAENRRLVPGRHFAAYGLGWGLSDYAGRLVVQHTGGVDGMLSAVGFLPEEGVGWVILTNRLPGSLHSALFFHILDAALGIRDNDWQSAFIEMDRVKIEKATEARKKIEKDRRIGTQPSLPLVDYAGGYTNEVYGKLTVSLEAGQLILHLGGHPNLVGPLEHWHADTFSCTWSNPSYEESFVHFAAGMDGKAETLRFKVAEFIDPLEYVFNRES